MQSYRLTDAALPCGHQIILGHRFFLKNACCHYMILLINACGTADAMPIWHGNAVIALLKWTADATLCIQVLLSTRHKAPSARAAAVAVVQALALELKEDYLTMLPEALPFVAELLEDLEAPVQAAAQHLLKELEGLAGENLDEYLK